MTTMEHVDLPAILSIGMQIEMRYFNWARWTP